MGSSAEIPITPAIISDEEANLFAMQLATATVLPMVLTSALELNLLEIISKNADLPGGQLSSAEITSYLPTKNPDAPVMVDRILRLLASYSILTCSVRKLLDGGGVERLYGLAPVCKYLTKNEDGVSLAALCLLNRDRVTTESWYTKMFIGN